MELKISKLLRVGVIIAAAFMLVGWIPQIIGIKNPFINFTDYDPIPLADHLYLHYRNREWWALISYLGLFTLISLPLLRVVFTAVLFIKRKEYTLAYIALFVLVGLIISFTLGAHE